jgi:hypothetical protein
MEGGYVFVVYVLFHLLFIELISFSIFASL